MEQYVVIGMSCAACSARVEKAATKVPSVTSCLVSLLINSMSVERSTSSQEIVKAMEAAGYDVAVRREMAGKPSAGNTDDMPKDGGTPVLRRRLYYLPGFLIVLVYFSMGYMVWNRLVFASFVDNHAVMGLLQLLFTGIITVIDQKFFISGSRRLACRAPDMDTLVALGSGASSVHSVYALLAMTGVQVNGGMAGAMPYMYGFYLESAAVVLTPIIVGEMLEAHSEGKTTDALRSLMKLAPRTTTLKVDSAEAGVSIDQVKKGDIFMTRPGEDIPVDGIVLGGSSVANGPAPTGESTPVDKGVSDQVSAATVNQSGYIACEASRAGEDTTLPQTVQMVSDAATTKASTVKATDRVFGVFMLTIITITAVTILVQLIVGESIRFTLARGTPVLVISCPRTLGLVTLAAITVGSGMGAEHGIMFKIVVSLKETGKVEAMTLDKTGTITSGEPRVTDVTPVEGTTERQLLELAFPLEKKSEHPLAKAVLVKAGELGIQAQEVSDFKALPGNGLFAILENCLLCDGNFAFVSSQAQITEETRTQSERLAKEGKTSLFSSHDGVTAGIITVADAMREDSPQTVKKFQDTGIHMVMFTGDNECTARAAGKQVDVDEMIAGVPPDEKESMTRSLKKKGRVAVVGDSINSAPTLTRADIGIAIGAGMDTTIDATDVVLTKSRLRDVSAAARMNWTTLRSIHENLFWVFLYSAVEIPLAAGLRYLAFGWKLNPMFGAAATSLPSFYVVTNALRFSSFEMYDGPRDKKIKVKRKEEREMVETVKIEGMVCGYYEARVKKYLEGLAQVGEAVVSHEAGTAVVALSRLVNNNVPRKVVEDQDHKVLDIR